MKAPLFDLTRKTVWSHFASRALLGLRGEFHHLHPLDMKGGDALILFDDGEDMLAVVDYEEGNVRYQIFPYGHRIYSEEVVKPVAELFGLKHRAQVELINYRSLVRYHFAKELGIHAFRKWRTSLKPPYVALERMEILGFLVTHFSQSKIVDRGDIEEALNKKYKKAWDAHWSRYWTDTDAMLGSFCITGELKKVDIRYEIQPSVIVSYSNYQLDERRHSDAIRTQRLMTWLTVVLGVAAAAQAGAAVAPYVSKWFG